MAAAPHSLTDPSVSPYVPHTRSYLCSQCKSTDRQRGAGAGCHEGSSAPRPERQSRDERGCGSGVPGKGRARRGAVPKSARHPTAELRPEPALQRRLESGAVTAERLRSRYAALRARLCAAAEAEGGAAPPHGVVAALGSVPGRPRSPFAARPVLEGKDGERAGDAAGRSSPCCGERKAGTGRIGVIVWDGRG